MTSFRFLHCADLHLDSPLRGLETDPDAPSEKIRNATRGALEKLVDHAVSERVDFVVAAGDLYDGDWQDWRTGQFLVRQVRRLATEGIPFIAIRGNHDAQNVMTKHLQLPGEQTRLLKTQQPETFRLKNLPVSIHGQSFADRAVTENIALAYPLPDPHRFNIGLLHTAIDGRDGHDRYAPCSLEQLRDHGYEYWALGHVHKQDTLLRDPWIVFPGNLQGRHANETGPKGAMLVTVTDMRVSDAAFVALDVMRWVHVRIELAADADEETALAEIRDALGEELAQAGGRLLAVRVIVSGVTAAHDFFSRDSGAVREKIRSEALAVAGPDMIWIETIQVATRPLPHSVVSDQAGAIGQLIRALDAVGTEGLREGLRAYTTAMLDRASLLRQSLDATHPIVKAGEGEPPEDLIRRARDLLLGFLAE